MPTVIEIAAEADLEIMPVGFEVGVMVTMFVAVEKGVPCTVTML